MLSKIASTPARMFGSRHRGTLRGRLAKGEDRIFDPRGSCARNAVEPEGQTIPKHGAKRSHSHPTSRPHPSSSHCVVVKVLAPGRSICMQLGAAVDIRYMTKGKFKHMSMSHLVCQSAVEHSAS